MSQDFSKAKIYKITNDFNDEVYVGSTCDTLVKRFSAHKCSIYNNTKNNRPIYKLMNEIGFERFRIELIEDFLGTDKYQMRQREGYWIKKIGTLNMIIAGRTNKEYNDEHKEYRQEYNEMNKSKISERNKEYTLKNPEKWVEYKKKHYEINKEKIQEYKKEYYLKKKEELVLKVVCECGCEIAKSFLTKHQKTKKHLDLLAKNQLAI